jgi:hypothetical protein
MRPSRRRQCSPSGGGSGSLRSSGSTVAQRIDPNHPVSLSRRLAVAGNVPRDSYERSPLAVGRQQFERREVSVYLVLAVPAVELVLDKESEVSLVVKAQVQPTKVLSEYHLGSTRQGGGHRF